MTILSIDGEVIAECKDVKFNIDPGIEKEIEPIKRGKIEVCGSMSPIMIEGLNAFVSDTFRKPPPQIEYIWEWFHPAGPVFYEILHNVKINNSEGLFMVTNTTELRQV